MKNDNLTNLIKATIPITDALKYAIEIKDLNGDRVIKTKTFSSIKSAASNEDIMAVVNALVGLQQHTLSAVNRIDYSSLSE